MEGSRRDALVSVFALFTVAFIPLTVFVINILAVLCFDTHMQLSVQIGVLYATGSSDTEL